jgi:trehalose 6-phosphate synthase
VVNRRHAQLLLSPEAGAWDELGVEAWRADPFDVGATADALGRALDASPAERERRARTLRAASLARAPAAWLADQVAAAD